MTGVGRRRKDRPFVGGGIELRDVPRIPERHPDVVVPVGDDSVDDGVVRRHGEHGHLLRLAIVLAQRAAHDPADVDVVLRVEGDRLRPLVRAADHVVGIQRDRYVELLRLRVEAKQMLRRRRRLTSVFGKPDHAGPIDIHLVDAVDRTIRQHERLLLARPRIELDQPVRIAAIGQPHVAVRIEPYVLARAPAGEAAFELGELRRMDALSRTVRRQVVLDVHRLAHLRLVDRHLLVHAHRARWFVGPEVFGQILHQRFAILAREPQRRRAKRQEPFGVRCGRLVEQVAPLHAIEPQVPRADRRRLGGEEVLAVADHAGSFRDLAARPGRKDLVVAGFLRHGAVAAVLTLERADDRALRGRRGVLQRQRDFRVVAGLDDQLLHVRTQRVRAGADLVVAGEERRRAELAAAGVDHEQHPLVDVADEHLRGLERGCGLDRARQAAEPRQRGGLDDGRDAGQRRAHPYRRVTDKKTSYYSDQQQGPTS